MRALLACVLAALIAAGVALVVTHPGGRHVTAYFADASALFPDNQVMVLGVPVGTIVQLLSGAVAGRI